MRKPTRLTPFRKLLALAHAGWHGRTWYRDAATELGSWARSNGWPVDDVLAAFAAGSPRTTVAMHAEVATSLLTDGAVGRPPLPVHIALWNRYQRTGRIDPMGTARKVAAFWRALNGDESAIPIDVWMMRALGMTDKHVRRVASLDAAETRIRKLADMLGWTPAETQAAVWTGIYEQSTGNPAPKVLR